MIINKFLLLMFVLLLITFTASEAFSQEMFSGEFLVKIRSTGNISAQSTGISSLDELNKKFGVVKMEEAQSASGFTSQSFNPEGTLYKVTYKSNLSVQEAVNAYSADANVVYAEPDYIGHIALIPDDSLYSRQSDLVVMKTQEAWDVSTGNKNIIVAVIDTGVNINHPDLISNIWSNTDESANSSDDDTNGYIDDIQGWDFASNDSDPSDEYGHGTSVAGIIGAVGNNGQGVAGTAWNCQIMPVRIGNESFSLFNAVNGIRYAADNGAKILNLSWTFDVAPLSLSDAINYAVSKGCIIVAAAGNANSSVKYPAAYENVIAVAATDNSDKKADFSCYGTEIDICAPGVDIVTTALKSKIGSDYGSGSGTSFSTPRVVGALALLMGQNPSASTATIKQILFDTADNIDGLNSGFEGKLGKGRLNLEKAIKNTSNVESSLTLTLQGTNQWVLVSFPFESISNVTGLKRPLYNYENNAFQIVPPTGYNQIKAGKSYWTFLTESSTLTVTGKSVANSSYTINLSSGWNQVGNPFNQKVTLNSANYKTSANGVMQMDVNSKAYLYSNGIFNILSLAEAYLSPWTGYWFYSSSDCLMEIKK